MGNKFSWVVEGDWLLDYTQLSQLSIMRSLTSTWGNWKAQPESREIFLVGLPSWGTQNIQVCHSHVRDQMDIHSWISEYWFFVSFWWKSKLWYCMQYCFSMMCLFLLKKSVTSLIEVNIVLNLKTWNIARFFDLFGWVSFDTHRFCP